MFFRFFFVVFWRLKHKKKITRPKCFVFQVNGGVKSEERREIWDVSWTSLYGELRCTR